MKFRRNGNFKDLLTQYINFGNFRFIAVMLLLLLCCGNLILFILFFLSYSFIIIKNPFNSSYSLSIRFLSWYFRCGLQEAMFREEIALPYCGPQKHQNKGLRAKGEVIAMLSERLRGRKKMALPGWPLRWQLLLWSPTIGVPRQSRVMLRSSITIL